MYRSRDCVPSFSLVCGNGIGVVASCPKGNKRLGVTTPFFFPQFSINHDIGGLAVLSCFISEVVEALLEGRYKVCRILHPARYADEAVRDANLQPDATGAKVRVGQRGGGGLLVLPFEDGARTSRSYSEQRDHQHLDALCVVLPIFLI